MNYFIRSKDREHTNYHEFQKGCYDGKTVWKSDSICLSDNTMYELQLIPILAECIPHYDCYDVTAVNRKTWEKVKARAAEAGGQIQECIAEADIWAEETFQEHRIFTIIGICFNPRYGNISSSKP